MNIATTTTAAAQAETETSLITSIIEAPDDDGPRLVYADWLAEHGGDPERGEFIILQCKAANGSKLTRAETTRVGVLLADNEARWLGDLSRVVSARYKSRFERGLLTHFVFRSKPVDLGPQSSSIAFVRSALVSLEQLPSESRFIPWLTTQPWRSLIDLRGGNDALVIALLTSSTPKPIKRLGFHQGRQAANPAVSNALSSGQGLPDLEQLVLHDSSYTPLLGTRWIFETPRARPLSLAFDASPTSAVDYIRTANEAFRNSPNVRELVLLPNALHANDRAGAFAISQDKKGMWSTLRVINAPYWDASTLSNIFRGFVEYSVRRIVLDVLPTGDPSKVRAQLRESVKHLPRLQLDLPRV